MKTLFVGDICATPATEELYRSRNTQKLFGDTVELFKNTDMNFINLECAITESDGAIRKFGPNLKSPLEMADVFAELKVTVAGISNNHTFDYGRVGARDTIEALTKAGIDYTGFGDDLASSKKNYIFEKDGERICIIAVCEHEYTYALDDRMGSRPFDEFETIEEIREAKKDADRVIVAYHGGKELCHYPSPRLMRACRAMIRAGADLVLCQHTHCLGAYESYNGGHILYGQGNFNFVKAVPMPDCWKEGLAVRYDTKANTVELIPTVENETGDGIRLANEAEKARILADIKKYSDSVSDGTWQDGWHEFCIRTAPDYLKRIALVATEGATDSQNAILGHYIDCEAHLDLLKEYFKSWNYTNERD